jgi:hypothetical protein
MSERQMFRAIVRGVGVFQVVGGVESLWFSVNRLLGLVSAAGYRYSGAHDFLDASIVLIVAYIVIRKSDWIVRLVYGPESEPEKISN